MSEHCGSGIRSSTRALRPRRCAAAASLTLAALASFLGSPGSSGPVLQGRVAEAAVVEGTVGLTPVLPHTIHRGKPPGAAALRGVDWSRARHGELPAPEGLAVLWQRRIAGGLSGDVLVDDAGRIFATGQGRVLQLGADGREQYLRRAEFSSAVASALLADGQRVVLAREGTLAAWSVDGDLAFRVELQVPAGWTRGDLLPLPEGSVLVSTGTWLLLVSARGRIEGYTQLKEAAAETLVSAGQTWILTERGDVLTWDGRSPPVKQGSLDGRASTGAVRAPGQLLAVLDGRELVEWSLTTGQRRSLAHLEGAGASARLSVPSSSLVHILGANGALFSVPVAATGNADTPPEPQQLPAGPGELVSSADGGLAWFVSNAPLTLQRRNGVTQSLAEVVCAQPSSLMPAGSGRLLAACRSGQLWLIGPSAPPSAPSDPPVDLGRPDEHPTAPARPPPASNP
ncbi:MAG: hypothetical protein ABI895_10180 [Deltaproteobacteria bacterium]